VALFLRVRILSLCSAVLLDPAAVPSCLYYLRLYPVLRLSGWILPAEGIEGQQGHSAAVWKAVPDPAACAGVPSGSCATKNSRTSEGLSVRFL